MTKPKDDKQTLLEKVKEWLAKEGYSLEMKVARQFNQKSDFIAFQGQYYWDEEEKKAREIDVVGRIIKPSQNENHLSISIEFITECKWSKNKPWVLFSSPGKGVINVLPNNPEDHGFNLLTNLSEIKTLPPEGFFYGPGKIAHGITLALKGDGNKAESPQEKQHDKAFNACRQVCSGLAYKTQGFGGGLGLFTGTPGVNANIRIPLIVLDGELFSAELDPAGNLVVEEADFGRLTWKHYHSTNYITLDIVRYTYLDTYLDQVTEEVEIVLKACSADLELVTKSVRALNLELFGISKKEGKRL